MGKTIFHRIYTFYRNGFQNMQLGKKLWMIVLIKLFILFAVIKLLFFPDILHERFQSDRQRSNYILNQLTQGE